MGRYGSNDDDNYVYQPARPRSKPRIRIIPQRKATKKRVMYEPNEQGMHAREFIKRMVLDNDRLSVRDMMPTIEKAGYSISIVAVSNYRTEFMHSLSLLKTLGWRQPKPKP
jgi:hypothetical protein